MKRLRLLLLVILLPFVRPVAQEAAGKTMTLDEAVALIVSNNPDIRLATEAVKTAERRIGSVFTYDNSRLSLSGAYAGTSPDTGAAAQTGGLNAAASVTVPVLPLVSASGSIDQRGNGSVSVTVKPFEKAVIDPTLLEALNKARARLESLLRETKFSAENVLLTTLSRAADLSAAKRAMDLKQQNYEMENKLYGMGEAPLSDLQDASSSYAGAVQQYYSAQKASLDTRRSLLLLLGPDVPSAGIEAMSLDGILGLVAKRNEDVKAKAGASPVSLNVKNDVYTLDRLEAQLKATPLWKPDLSLTGKLGFPTSSWNVGVSLSFSPSDLKTDERTDLLTQIADTKSDLAIQNYLLVIDRDRAERTLEISVQSLEAAKLNRERTDSVLEETQLLYKQGERTVLELAQAELDSVSAENTVFQKAVDLLKAQNDYLLMFPE